MPVPACGRVSSPFNLQGVDDCYARFQVHSMQGTGKTNGSSQNASSVEGTSCAEEAAPATSASENGQHRACTAGITPEAGLVDHHPHQAAWRCWDGLPALAPARAGYLPASSLRLDTGLKTPSKIAAEAAAAPGKDLGQETGQRGQNSPAAADRAGFDTHQDSVTGAEALKSLLPAPVGGEEATLENGVDKAACRVQRDKLHDSDEEQEEHEMLHDPLMSMPLSSVPITGQATLVPAQEAAGQSTCSGESCLSRSRSAGTGGSSGGGSALTELMTLLLPAAAAGSGAGDSHSEAQDASNPDTAYLEQASGGRQVANHAQAEQASSNGKSCLPRQHTVSESAAAPLSEDTAAKDPQAYAAPGSDEGSPRRQTSSRRKKAAELSEGTAARDPQAYDSTQGLGDGDLQRQISASRNKAASSSRETASEVPPTDASPDLDEGGLQRRTWSSQSSTFRETAADLQADASATAETKHPAISSAPWEAHSGPLRSASHRNGAGDWEADDTTSRSTESGSCPGSEDDAAASNSYEKFGSILSSLLTDVMATCPPSPGGSQDIHQGTPSTPDHWEMSCTNDLHKAPEPAPSTLPPPTVGQSSHAPAEQRSPYPTHGSSCMGGGRSEMEHQCESSSCPNSVRDPEAQRSASHGLQHSGIRRGRIESCDQTMLQGEPGGLPARHAAVSLQTSDGDTPVLEAQWQNTSSSGNDGAARSPRHQIMSCAGPDGQEAEEWSDRPNNNKAHPQADGGQHDKTSGGQDNSGQTPEWQQNMQAPGHASLASNRAALPERQADDGTRAKPDMCHRETSSGEVSSAGGNAASPLVQHIGGDAEPGDVEWESSGEPSKPDVEEAGASEHAAGSKPVHGQHACSNDPSNPVSTGPALGWDVALLASLRCGT